MFFFIQPWSGQSGSGFFPHSAAPPSSFAAVLPASVALVVALVVAPDALGAADAVGSALALVAAAAEADAAGALDAIGGTLVVPGVGGDDSDFVQATSSAAIETTSESERMGGELTRNPG